MQECGLHAKKGVCIWCRKEAGDKPEYSSGYVLHPQVPQYQVFMLAEAADTPHMA